MPRASASDGKNFRSGSFSVPAAVRNGDSGNGGGISAGGGNRRRRVDYD